MEYDPELLELAGSLGTTAEYLWNVLVEAAPAVVIADALTCLVYVLGIFACFKLNNRFQKRFSTATRSNDEDFKDLVIAASSAVLGFLTVVAVFLICIVVYDVLLVFVLGSPEYWALHKVLELCNN